MRAREIIIDEPVTVQLNSPVCICGDIHGQYYDLINLFKRCPSISKKTSFPNPGSPSQDAEEPYKFLFLGDYVDRGFRSIEVVVTLLAIKIIDPAQIYTLRGNHEDENIMRLYGFFDECKRRYSLRLFKVFTDLFRVLPVAAVVNQSIFCMHGGLSPELRYVGEIPDLRPCNIPTSGIICDLLWADPETNMASGIDWSPSSRGVSYVFSQNVLEKFLKENELDLICRAHQVVDEGYQFFPSNQRRWLLTVFSATNYCNEFGNKGGVLCVNEDGVCSILTLQPPNFGQERDIGLFREALPKPESSDGA
ncbi:protein phosphatase 1, catalytic subunit [Angomonas deanei]|nr:protein phosphatase 1, catalytic subunit [Angomonas deanei]|eukprot:EPY36326.1 protein phosphatase 1, catalytic subunit [Angomonas deanei]